MPFVFRLIAGLIFLVPATIFAQQTESSRHTEGLHENKPKSFVLKGAKVVVRPGSVIEDATIVIRDGRISSVRGADTWPADHQVIDLTGKTIYAGLIDGYREEEIVISETPEHARYWNVNIRPERDVTRSLAWKEESVSKLRDAGITAALVSPGEGIFKGSASLLLCDTNNPEQSVVKYGVAQSVELTVQRRFDGPRVYPSSPMGAVALARQALYDARWYRDSWQAVSTQPNINRPEINDSLQVLQDVVNGKQPILVSTSNELMTLRADRFAREFNANLMIVGSGSEYRRLNDIAQLKRPMIIPLNFPKAPNVKTPEDELDVTLEALMQWDLAPENPARLAKAGVEFAFTTDGLENPEQFLQRVRQAVARGLNADVALAALTTVPAKFYGAESQIGSVETGKLANLIVTDGDLFNDKTKIVETWVAGRRYEVEEAKAEKPAGEWKMSSSRQSSSPNQEELGDAATTRLYKLVLTADKKNLTGTIQYLRSENSAEQGLVEIDAFDEPVDETTDNKEPDAAAPEVAAQENAEKDDRPKKQDIKDLQQSGSRITGSFSLKDYQPGDDEGIVRFSLVISTDNKTGVGTLQWPDGKSTPLKAELIHPGKTTAEEPAKDAEQEDEKSDEPTADEVEDEKPEGKGRGRSRGGDAPKYSKEPASCEPNYPLGKYGVSQPVEKQRVLFQGMTVWTSGPQGVLENASVLVEDGIIRGIFANGTALPQVENIVSGEGLHLTPGIIDCHSHMATDSGVNEGSQAITSEVRIGDFIDCNDITIYRQLAGGVTSSNILHGSANPIGGQNQVIKLRWGLNDEAMKFAEAPQGIKFALGENVKRSNSRGDSGEPARYPASRMGVEQLMHDTFRAAMQYRDQHAKWNETRQGLPPRRDLELDAIVEILEGKRWIHCHSYRQDEILALIRVLDEYKITIGTFQHILEGYKVAEKMAEHGAMASAFADWWAYKFEVYDAIPYGGALMHEAGIVVSFNSDDGELATHMNQEAAKAVKYGGVAPDEALKFVTLNPAKQLRVDKYVGSIELGKHADLVVWNGPPLSIYSRVQQTWVDGRKYFSAPESPGTQTVDESGKIFAALVQKVLQSGEEMSGDDENERDPQRSWLRHDEFCGAHLNKSDDAKRLLELQQAWENEEEEQ